MDIVRYIYSVYVYNHNVITHIYILYIYYIYIHHSFIFSYLFKYLRCNPGPVTGLLPTARWDAAADAAWPGGLQLRSASASARTGEVGF